MQLLKTNRAYVHFLLANASMAISLLLLYRLGQVLESFPLLLLFIVLACLCPMLEVLLGIVAAARRQWLLVFLYSLVSVAFFFADRWLLDQFE